MEPIEEKVRAIITGEIPELTAAELTDDAELVRDLGADSLDVELIRGEVEEQFNVDVTDEAMEKLKTVGDVVNLVRQLKIAVQ